MQCSKCGKSLEQGAKFCPYCGEPISEMENKIDISNKYPESERNTSEKNTVGKIEQVAQNIKNVLDEDDHLTEMTDDEYRNKLVKQARILNVCETISFFICVKVVWNYHQIFNWKDGIIVGLISLFATGLISEIIGSDRYFGEKRIQRYDKIKKSSSKNEAVTVMENNKGGTIRVILTILHFTIGMLLISDFCCEQYANMVLEKRIDKALDNASFSTNEKMEDIVNKLQKFTVVEKSDNRYSFINNGEWILVIDAENEFVNFKEEAVAECMESFMGDEILVDYGASAGGFCYVLSENIIRIYCDTEVEEGRLTCCSYDIDNKEFTFRIGKDDYYASDEFVEWTNEYGLVEIMEADIQRFKEDLEENGIRMDDIYKLKYKDVDKYVN